MLGSQWSKDELERFYDAYRKHGTDWRKIAGAICDRTSDMVEALYNMNKAYLSLPEGTATAAGLIAMMADHYNILDGSNSDRESNDSPKASSRPQKRGRSEFQSVFKTFGTDYTDPLQPQPASSSYGCLSVLKKKRSGDENSALDALHTLADLSVNILPPSPVVESGSAIMYIRRDPRQRWAVRGRHSTDTGAIGAEDSRAVHRPRRLAVKRLASQDLPRGTLRSRGGIRIPAKKSSLKKLPKKQGINAPKTKGNSSGEPFQHRFSVHRIRELKFNEDQIGWINDAGLGALLAMSEISLPVKLVAWVMKNINPELREFRIKNKAIVFDKQLVCNILGVPSGEEPLKLRCTADEYEVFQVIREPFMDGVRGPLTKCKEILSKAKDKTTFMRAFVLLALGTVLCPGTDNAITAKYLHSLKDVSQIKSFDWAGHILDVLMAEVRKYHACLRKDEVEGVSSSPYLGSCLIIPAIAYMDCLDIGADRATHKINYSLPRICHVSNKDFEFVEMVDRSRLHLNAFGQRPFRTTSPCPTPVPMSGYIPPPPPMPEEEAVTPSLEDCLDPPGTSSHPAVHTTSAPIEPLPEEYQVLLAEHNSLVEKDVDELMQSMKEQIKQIMAKRGAELAYKMNRLNTEKDVANLATKLSHVKNPSNDNEIMHPPSPVEPRKKTCSPLESTEHASTSTPPTPREESTKRTESFPSTEPTTGEHQKTKSVPSTNPTRGEHQREPNPSSPPILPLEESTKEPHPSRPPNPPKDSRKEPNASPTVSASKGHYVLINLFGPEDALFEDVCGEGSRSPSPTGDINIEASNEKQTGSSTFEKRNGISSP